MRVLYVSQYFVRGDQPGGVRHWHHTQALRNRGHDVHIVTSYVQHKERTIPERFRGKKVVRENEDGVTMWFTYSTPGYGRDLRSRLSNYLSFATWSAVAGFRAPRPDVVLASSPSLPSAAATAMVAMVKRVPFVFEVRDLWPESAIAMGLVRPGSAFARVAALLERFCYRRAAHVIALTDGIRDGVIAKGVAPQRVTLVTNGVDRLPAPPSRAAVPVPDDAFVAMYVGAHGTYSSLDTVLEAADLLRDRTDIRFVFVGGGDQAGTRRARTGTWARHGVLHRLRAEVTGALLACTRRRLPAAVPGQGAVCGRTAEQDVRLHGRRQADHRSRARRGAHRGDREGRMRAVGATGRPRRHGRGHPRTGR